MSNTRRGRLSSSRTIAALVLLVASGCAGGSDGQQQVAEVDVAHDSGDARPVRWGYGPDDGPDSWGSLSADWATCDSGTSQSPIDLSDAAVSSGMEEVQLDLPETSVHIIRQEHVFEALHNGHTIQVNVDAGDTLEIGEQSFDLLQYHFHAPSEHTVDGEHYPMEMHLVHTSEAGDLAVVGVFIEAGDHNAAFDTVWSNLPSEPGETRHIEHVMVDIDELLPSDSTAWRYRGSLTTPPCSEAVRWIVLKKPVQLDADQIDRFLQLFSGNNRPTQPLNDRKLVTDGLPVSD